VRLGRGEAEFEAGAAGLRVELSLLLPPAALLKNTNDGKSVVLARLTNAAIVNAPNVYPLNGPTANWTRLLDAPVNRYAI
jgi:hypothetical protein